MTMCVPMKELKNTAEFTRTVCEAEGPVIVTKNGKGAFVSLSMEMFEALKLEAARARLYQAVDRAESDVSNGRVVSSEELVATLRARHGA